MGAAWMNIELSTEEGPGRLSLNILQRGKFPLIVHSETDVGTVCLTQKSYEAISQWCDCF